MKEIIIVNSSSTFEYRIKLFKKVMNEAGHHVTVIGSDYDHIEKKKRDNDDPDAIYIPTIQYKKNISLKRIRSHFDFSKKAYKLIKNRTCDFLYIVIPSNSQGTIAKKYRKLHPETKIVMDIIDLWPESFPNSYTGLFPFTLWSSIRNKSLKFADMIITECNLYHKYIEKYARSDIFTIYWSHNKNDYPVKPEKNLENDKWVLGYLGSVNNIIDIGAIVDVIKEFRKSRPVVIKIIGSGEKMDEFIEAVRFDDIQVINYGKIYDFEKKLEIFSTCHYGINIMKPTVCIGMSMKAVDYFEMGVPLLNGVPGDMHEIVNEYNTGVNTDNLNFEYDLNMRENARKFYIDNCSYEAFKNNVYKYFLNNE